MLCQQLSTLGSSVHLDPLEHSKLALEEVDAFQIIINNIMHLGFLAQSLGFATTTNLVWYILFTIFAPYSMLPLPLKWCICGGSLTAVGHLLYLLVKEFHSIIIVDKVKRIL